MSTENTPISSLRPLRIATRESRLALWQAHHVQDVLQAQLQCTSELLGMTTRGDQILDRSLSKVGGKGLFVKELEMAMQEGRADLAVHSLKDVPMTLPPGFDLIAILARENPQDVWVSPRYAQFTDLPQGACVGTSSLRRVVQLLALRPDLNVQPIRGNLDSRLAKLDAGQFDGIVLAGAGLSRLGLSERIRHLFSLDDMLPCAGQGALGLEVPTGHASSRALSGLSDARTWLATQFERAISRLLSGSCSIPLAAHCHWQDDQTLQAGVVLGHALNVRSPLLKAQRMCTPSAAVLLSPLSGASLTWVHEQAQVLVQTLATQGDVNAYLEAARQAQHA